MWNGIQPTGAGQPLPVLQNPEPVACDECRGPTPFHPEPGRETRLRRGYWRFDRWETRYVRPTKNPADGTRIGRASRKRPDLSERRPTDSAAWSSGSSSGS